MDEQQNQNRPVQAPVTMQILHNDLSIMKRQIALHRPLFPVGQEAGLVTKKGEIVFSHDHRAHVAGMHVNSVRGSSILNGLGKEKDVSKDPRGISARWALQNTIKILGLPYEEHKAFQNGMREMTVYVRGAVPVRVDADVVQGELLMAIVPDPEDLTGGVNPIEQMSVTGNTPSKRRLLVKPVDNETLASLFTASVRDYLIDPAGWQERMNGRLRSTQALQAATEGFVRWSLFAACMAEFASIREGAANAGGGAFPAAQQFNDFLKRWVSRGLIKDPNQVLGKIAQGTLTAGDQWRRDFEGLFFYSGIATQTVGEIGNYLSSGLTAQNPKPDGGPKGQLISMQYNGFKEVLWAFLNYANYAKRFNVGMVLSGAQKGKLATVLLDIQGSK